MAICGFTIDAWTIYTANFLYNEIIDSESGFIWLLDRPVLWGPILVDSTHDSLITIKMWSNTDSILSALLSHHHSSISTMTPKALTFNAAPGLVLELLNARLPTSLPLLRRLQFSQLPEGTTSNARIVFVSDSADLRDDPPEAFTVAYLDFSFGPDTQSWMYSTLEDPSSTSAEAVYDDQLAVLINEIIRLKKEYGKPLVYPDSLLVGTLHSHVRQLLERSGRAKPRATGNYDKWLFRFENLPSAEEVLPEGMYWDKASLEDCQIVVSRSDLPRRACVAQMNRPGYER